MRTWEKKLLITILFPIVSFTLVSFISLIVIGVGNYSEIQKAQAQKTVVIGVSIASALVLFEVWFSIVCKDLFK